MPDPIRQSTAPTSLLDARRRVERTGAEENETSERAMNRLLMRQVADALLPKEKTASGGLSTDVWRSMLADALASSLGDTLTDPMSGTTNRRGAIE